MHRDEDQFHKMLEQFLAYLRIERGLSSNTTSSYASDLRIFFSFLSQSRIDSLKGVSRQDIVRFCAVRGEQKLSAKSLHRAISAIRRFFWFLRKENQISIDPAVDIDLPRVEKKLPRYARPQQIDDLLSAPTEVNIRGIRDAAIIAILYATGLRVSELTALSLSDIDLMRGYLRAVGKGKKTRLVPINERAQEVLNHYLKRSRPSLLSDKKSNLLFIRKGGLSLSRQSIWKIIKKYARLSGLSSDFSPHQLRHSFATHLLEGGVNLRALQLMLGHSDLSTTEVYMHVDKKHLVALYDKHHPRSTLK